MTRLYMFRKGDAFIMGTVAQFFWLPCMIVRDLFEKPSSRTLAERLAGAASYQMNGVARYVLARGANPNLKDDNTTLLALAAEKGCKPLVKRLLEKGADPNLCVAGGTPPLWRAASNGHARIAAALLEKGADIEARGGSGQTPLITAAEEGRPAMVAFLIKKGADVLAAGLHDQLTALDHARKKDYADILSLLEPATQAALAAQTSASPAALPPGATGSFNPSAAPIAVMSPITLKPGAPAPASTP